MTQQITNTINRSRPRILLVEDNPGDVDLFRLALKTAHFDCDLTVLDDGGEAMALVKREGKYADLDVPDLVVLDLNVPKNDGIEIVASMRSSEVFRETQVVVLSSSSSPRDYAKLENFRIAKYITKPPDLDEFLNIGTQLMKIVFP
jgi:two-component system response regulator